LREPLQIQQPPSGLTFAQKRALADLGIHWAKNAMVVGNLFTIRSAG
jgi:hypothetical protein